MEECKIKNMYDLNHTIAKELLEKHEYPWEVLPEISDFIIELGNKLDKEIYELKGENIWIAKSATIYPSAYIKGPAIIGENAEVRHCAFIRGKAIVGNNAVVGNSTELKNVILFDKVQVQIGAMKLKVDIKYLQEKVSSSKNTNNYSYTGRNNLKSQSVSPEINLLGLTVDEAVPLVDKYLDDCFMAKLSPVRIVHGKGTGALRNGIHKYLKTNKYVDSYRMGTFGEGEMGVTIVTLKIK